VSSRSLFGALGSGLWRVARLDFGPGDTLPNRVPLLSCGCPGLARGSALTILSFGFRISLRAYGNTPLRYRYSSRAQTAHQCRGVMPHAQIEEKRHSAAPHMFRAYINTPLRCRYSSRAQTAHQCRGVMPHAQACGFRQLTCPRNGRRAAASGLPELAPASVCLDFELWALDFGFT